MKTKFRAYYPLTVKQKKELFNNPDTYFILDTNALLDIYRLGKTVSKRVIKLFNKYKKQIKIPYHVAEEYHEHIYDVLIECDCLYDTLIDKITEDYIISLIKNDCKDQFKYDHITNMLKKHIKEALNGYKQKINAEKKFISQQLKTWSLPNELAGFLSDTMLDKLSEEKIKEIESDGENRQKNNLPPGYKDKSKNNGNQYGDLIIWKEILAFAQNNPNNPIVFVSRDINKGDWQWILHNRKCGLHPYLLNEFYKISNADIIMYSLQDFINYANENENIFNNEEIKSIQAMNFPEMAITDNSLKQITNISAIKATNKENFKITETAKLTNEKSQKMPTPLLDDKNV